MLAAVITFGVVAILVLLADEASERGIPFVGRAVDLVGEAIWRLWLLLIGVAFVVCAVAVTYEVTGVAIVAWVAGLVAVVADVVVARWWFEWSFGGSGRRSELGSAASEPGPC